MYPTQQEIKEILSYDPETGHFTWLVDRHSNKVKGQIAGTLKEGYWVIHINRKNRRAHILAWIYMHGYEPDEIDHENQIKHDNRFDNLRLTTRVLNSQNRPVQKRNKSGVSGVFFNKSMGRWTVSITADKKMHYLGSFMAFEDAVKARREGEIKHNFGVHNA